jgi:hypothetical protein
MLGDRTFSLLSHLDLNQAQHHVAEEAPTPCNTQPVGGLSTD